MRACQKVFDQPFDDLPWAGCQFPALHPMPQLFGLRRRPVRSRNMRRISSRGLAGGAGPGHLPRAFAAERHRSDDDPCSRPQWEPSKPRRVKKPKWMTFDRCGDPNWDSARHWWTRAGFFLQCFRVRFDPFNPALRVCPRGPSIDPSLEGKGLSLGQPVIFLRGHLKLWLAPEDGLVKQTMICGTRTMEGCRVSPPASMDARLRMSRPPLMSSASSP